ncbi:MAG: DUF2953 domain-containing protein [Firmicutes bacterium]|uniref:DUF2953 domain-containing protein n=1 Tax=Candidatus Scybalomonas excrementavium TaxID=2840943 RepID=A0A9D9N847_9FIRM|nr:DUF2953 domain-containing protein [Candidatus Scybalomonas excrementavium]
MIHVLIMMLKIIGWLLLILIGLLLVVLGTVLFSPIRYRFDMEYHDKLEGKAKITWFSHSISIDIEYQENQPHYQIRIFGIQLFPKTKKKKQKTRKKKVERKQKTSQTIGHLSPIKEENKKNEEKFSSYEEETQKEKNSIREIEKNKKQENKKEVQSTLLEKEEEKLPIIIEEKRQKRNSFKKFLYSIPKKIQRILKKWKYLLEKIQYYRSFYKDEVTKRAIEFTKKTLKKLCLHTLPRKFEGMIVFGTSDPALTGQILGILSIAMPFYKEKLRLYPVFDESTFAFEVKGKGRVQIGYYVYLALRFWFQKDVKQVITRIRKEFRKI